MAKKEHLPTDEQRGAVRALCTIKTPHTEIARYLGVDAKTLRKYYRAELDDGTLKLKIGLLNQAYKRAVTDEKDAVLIFLLKTVCGLREVVTPESPLSTDELRKELDALKRQQEQLEKIYKKDF